MSTDKTVWMVNVKDTESISKIPNLPEGEVRSVSFGSACLNVVTGGGKLLTSKIKDVGKEDWKQPPGLTQVRLTQVESGLSHHVAITTDNKLVSWGKNDHGQLGRGDIHTKKCKKGKRKDIVFSASPISYFQNMRICTVSCGNSHTLCLSEEGRVYSWGANDCNQLGLGNSSTVHCTKPHLVEELSSIHIAQISAGGHHSFALSITGLAFCWGSNRCGQLGFENNPRRSSRFYQIIFPSSCVEKARAVCCGENHTAFLTLDGHVYTCGLGTSGQLGHGTNTENQFTPRAIEELQNKSISSIACGRDYTIVYSQSTNTLHYFGAQRKSVTNLPSGLDGPTLKCGKDFFFIYGSHVDNDGEKCSRSQSLTLDTVMSMMRKQQVEDCDNEIKDMLSRALSQAPCVNGSFQAKDAQSCHGFDLEAADEFFNEVRKPSYHGIAEQALKTLLKSVSHKTMKTDGLRMLLFLPCCLYTKKSPLYCEDIVISMSNFINGLREAETAVLGKWLKSISTHYFKRYLSFFRRCLKRCFSRLQKVSDPSTLTNMPAVVESCTKVLDMLNEVNKHRCKPILFDKFYISNLVDVINITGDFVLRLVDIRNNMPTTFRFCKYPFLYSPASKAILLKSGCLEIMTRNCIIFLGLVIFDEADLKVRRNHLVTDTREGLSLKKADLRKRLDVKFVDENVVSGDGIRQEFFQLLIEELLQENFGACYYEEESNLQWFRVKGETEDSNLADLRFIGLICGLALYNGVTLHLHFPSALYKKLLDKPVSFEDLFDLMPVHYRSCKYLLEYPYDDIEDLLCLDFANPAELCPNGANIPVNHSNKEEYVEKVIDYYLNKRVQKEFESFREGFYTGMPKEFLGSFQPKELEEILVGNERYDFKALEKIVVYDGDYHRNHETIEMFWETFYDMELQDQKDFLIFLTGTYRIPAYGINRLQIEIIPRDGDDPDEMLPHAMTCTNSLLLPQYTNKESLKMMLLAAVRSIGFGLV